MEKREKNQTNAQKEKYHLEKWQVISLGMAAYDAIAMVGSYFLALWLRFDCRFSMIDPVYLEACCRFAIPYALLGVLVFWRMKLYNSLWQFASYTELLRIVGASAVTFFIHTIGITVFVHRMPVFYYIIGGLIQFLLTVFVRFAYRFVNLERASRQQMAAAGGVNRVLLIGAGDAGLSILRELSRRNPVTDVVCAIIDDDPNKRGRSLDGIQVVGNRDDILSTVEEYAIDKIVVALPSASVENRRDILNICKETDCELKNLPALKELLSGSATVSALKDVAVEDLLGRDQIRVDMAEIFQYLRGKVVLITGGGGSIGSELARQIAAHQPKQLILLDAYENCVYDIQQELRKKFPDLNLVTLVGSVRDSRRILQVFETYRPQVVYHAAAHKHVPLMEDSPCESIKNNAIGTYKTAYAAMLYGTERFVLISTDKAVNPTNIMGASKRMCEMVIQTFDHMIKAGTPEKLPLLYAHEAAECCMDIHVPAHPKTEFVAVRFGNVLGSNGSVIPLFKKQIAAGGPVTVTHPDIIRYFMTIPEAVSLVLQAGCYAAGGEIFVFDMGSPVKIDTLARNLIRLSGLTPDVDIKIEYTGLRPGEKLYEEKLMAEEGMRRTPNDLIHIGAPIPFDNERFLQQLTDIMFAANRNVPNIRELVGEIVTTYHPENVGKPREAAPQTGHPLEE